MSGVPQTSHETRKAMALVRRLAQAGAGLWHDIARGQVAGNPDSGIAHLLDPQDTAVALSKLLAQPNGAAEDRKLRRSDAPRLAQHPTGKDQRAPEFSTPPGRFAKSSQQRKTTDSTKEPQPDPKKASPDSRSSKHVGSQQKQAQHTEHAPKHKTHFRARTLKDVAKTRSAQKRAALSKDDNDSTPTQATAFSDQKTTTHGTRSEFASLHDYSRAQAGNSNLDQVGTMTKKPSNFNNEPPQTPTFKTTRQQVFPEKGTKSRPLGFSENLTTQDVAPLTFANNDPRLSDGGPVAVPEHAIASGWAQAPGFQIPEQGNIVPKRASLKEMRDLKLSKDVDDLGEAAWRNGVEPK